MEFDDPGVLTAEVSASVGIAGLMLIFLPFFLDRLEKHGAKLSSTWLRWSHRIAWCFALALLIPTTSATCGLVTLWDVADLAALTAGLTLATMWLVPVAAMLTIWLEYQVWSR